MSANIYICTCNIRIYMYLHLNIHIKEIYIQKLTSISMSGNRHTNNYTTIYILRSPNIHS